MEAKEWLGEHNQLGLDIWKNKYCYENETFDHWLDRITGGSEELKQLVKEQKFLYGGRILSNRGLQHLGKKVSLSNCYVISPPEDNIESIFEDCNGPLKALSKDEYTKVHQIDSSNEQNFKERLQWFNKVNAILETLPQFDCGSCGFANCRGLAARIAKGEVDDSLCRVKKR